MNAIKITIVRTWLGFLNCILMCARKILFFGNIKEPKNILIYKLGNIGDVVCAMPALRAVKEKFPGSRVTLLTSPGVRGAIGAKDFLEGVPYLDKIITYYSDDVSTAGKIFTFASALRAEKYDLFVQLPDDWARFRTLLRNEIFAKCIGVRSAFGFRVRTSNLFKKAQVDSTYKEKEVAALLKILERGGIPHKNVVFEFPNYGQVSGEAYMKIEALKKKTDILLGVCMGGKTDDKKWPIGRYGEVLRTLGKKHTLGVVFFGGPSEHGAIEHVAHMSGLSYINFAGLSIKESISAIKHMDAFLTNDTGPMHIAAAFGIPIVALFNVRSVYGSWFPYGERNIYLHKKFFACDYTKETCAKQSILAISTDEVIRACETILRPTTTR